MNLGYLYQMPPPEKDKPVYETDPGGPGSNIGPPEQPGESLAPGHLEFKEGSVIDASKPPPAGADRAAQAKTITTIAIAALVLYLVFGK
jgi:hypothetical protein